MSTMLDRIRMEQRGGLRTGSVECEAGKVEHWAKTVPLREAVGRRPGARAA